MANANNIKEKLLDQIETHPGHKTTKTPQEIFTRDTTRVKRLKWIVIVSWLLVIICFTIGAIFELNTRGVESDTLYRDTLLASISIIIFQALFMIAIVMTISLFIRSRTLTLHKIQTRLANIEEQLKRLSQGA